VTKLINIFFSQLKRLSVYRLLQFFLWLAAAVAVAVLAVPRLQHHQRHQCHQRHQHLQCRYK
jgi:hypothetical protein